MAVHKLHPSASLEDLALEIGASVDYGGGKVFNASGRSGVSRLRKPVEAAIEPAAPAAPDQHVELMRRVVDLLARPPAPPEVLVQAAAPAVVVAPRKWEFVMHRDSQGRLMSITATQE